MEYRIEKLQKFTDKRGDLVVFLKNVELDERRKRFGQIYFITFDGKGVVRGNHYHKKWREWFGIVNGVVEAKLQDVRTGECVTLTLSAEHSYYTRLATSPYVAHAFKSITRSASLLNYADAEWEDGDRYPHIVIPEKKHAK